MAHGAPARPAHRAGFRAGGRYRIGDLAGRHHRLADRGSQQSADFAVLRLQGGRLGRSRREGRPRHFRLRPAGRGRRRHRLGRLPEDARRSRHRFRLRCQRRQLYRRVALPRRGQGSRRQPARPRTHQAALRSRAGFAHARPVRLPGRGCAERPGAGRPADLRHAAVPGPSLCARQQRHGRRPAGDRRR